MHILLGGTGPVGCAKARALLDRGDDAMTEEHIAGHYVPGMLHNATLI